MTRRWLRDSAAVTAGVAALAVISAAPGHALDDCGVGMYYNNVYSSCEPWAPVGVNFAPGPPIVPGIGIPGPIFDPVPLGIGFDPLPVGIGFDADFGWNVPNIAPYMRLRGIPGVPGIGIPGIPGVHVPGIPDVRIPDVRVPVPDVRIPDVRVPDVRVPEVHIPEGHRR